MLRSPSRNTNWGRRFSLVPCLLPIVSLLPVVSSFQVSSAPFGRPRLSNGVAIVPLPHSSRQILIQQINQCFLSSASSPIKVAQQDITEYSELSNWLEGDDDDDDDDDNDYRRREERNDNDGFVEFDDESSSDCMAEFHRWSHAVNQTVAALEKKRSSLCSELVKAQGAEVTIARAQLLVSNLYMFQDPSVRMAAVMDWENNVEVKLELSDKYDSASAEADALFAQARKLKRGSQVVANLLEEVAFASDIVATAQADLLSAYSEITNTIEETRFALVKDQLIRTSRMTKFQLLQNDKDERVFKRNQPPSRRDKKPELGTPASNIRKLTSPGGCTIYVGRNRRGNEYLSLTLARSNDIWMHSRGCPGAHVLLLNRRGGPQVTDDCLQFAADLAIFYSDLRNEAKAPVTAADPKHILKPRGAPLGAVKIREEWKTFIGRPDQVPNELKVAREKSGQTDEYHILDKAKHRRRTKQAVEDDQSRRKQKQRERRAQK
jgi:predicted ribosome quality control (RQC) complex YloA/Tae2 family protein